MITVDHNDSASSLIPTKHPEGKWIGELGPDGGQDTRLVHSILLGCTGFQIHESIPFCVLILGTILSCTKECEKKATVIITTKHYYVSGDKVVFPPSRIYRGQCDLEHSRVLFEWCQNIQLYRMWRIDIWWKHMINVGPKI